MFNIKIVFRSDLVFALVGAVFAGSFSATALIIPPGGLTATPSGHDLILSFPTTAPNLYTVQTSPDFQHWTNCQTGTPGNGTIMSITMSNAISGNQGFYRLLIQNPLSLTLPQSTAFSILGYDCGGIKEQVTAGFDISNGYPSGVVGMSTTCGGSGRGGGYQTTTHNASAAVTWDFAGNVISAIPLTNGVTVDPTSGTDGFGDVIYNSGSVAYLVVPVPAAPNNVSAIQSNDQFQVSWTPNGVNPVAITSSTITATPVNTTASILTTTVTGPGTAGAIPTLQPQTTYQITITSTTIGGTSRASAPINVNTSPATIPPSAPTAVTASWPAGDPSSSTDTLTATWQAPDPGNSPIDQYLVKISGSDGGGTFTNSVSGTTLTTYFTVDYIPNWTVTVQAHNAAGWGPVSAPFTLGGL